MHVAEKLKNLLERVQQEVEQKGKDGLVHRRVRAARDQKFHGAADLDDCVR